MSRSEASSRALAMISFSCSRPIDAKTGLTWTELAVGLVLRATTQIEQEAAAVLLGWLWVDSTATVHNTKDRENHTIHRDIHRIRSCIGIDLHQLTTVAYLLTIASKLRSCLKIRSVRLKYLA